MIRTSDKMRARRDRELKRWKKFYDKQRDLHYQLREYGGDILDSDTFRSSAQNIQHGDVTVRTHCMNVAKYSLAISKKLSFLPVHKQDLVRGALLHDYFLYDWHKDDPANEHRKLHGFYHPGIALRNAERDFGLTEREKDIIQKHMWPMTIVPPVHVEGWIVTMADKYCSMMETVHIHKGHGPIELRPIRKRKYIEVDNGQNILSDGKELIG